MTFVKTKIELSKLQPGRNMQKALLIALLEPFGALRDAENAMDFSRRMALMEAAKALPWGAVWQYFCEKNGIPQDWDVMGPILQYEKEVLSRR